MKCTPSFHKRSPDFPKPGRPFIHLNSLCEASHKLFKRLKQNFPLKYFLGDNRNAIQIQIWISLIAWLLMQVVKKQVTKRKWSLSNLMTAVHILLNSYISLYDFLNLPEGQWLKIIQNRSPEDDISPQLELFPQKEGPNFENYKTNAYLQAVNQ